MKKIILSVAVATMALSTAAAALEDIKVNGQAKLWYETNDAGTNDMFDQGASSGEVVFKLGMTGKQGNVGFGTTIYETSTMGLENNLVSATRTNTANGDMYVGEAYITIPAGAKTILKIGKQELDTPLAFSERWNATPNTFNAAVAINNSIDNLTLIGAYVGQDSNPTNFKSSGTPNNTVFDTVLAAAALYKNDMIAANVWYYQLRSTAKALWIDATVNAGPAKITGYYATMMPEASVAAQDTDAYAIKVAGKVSGVKLMAAYSSVSDDAGLAVGNTATGFKKTKLPTAGVYTDGLYVAQNGSDALKVKAAGKLGSTGLALQYIDNENDMAGKTGLNAQELDLIITQKIGDVNVKAILMNRDWDNASDQNHVRVIASVNF